MGNKSFSRIIWFRSAPLRVTLTTFYSCQRTQKTACQTTQENNQVEDPPCKYWGGSNLPLVPRFRQQGAGRLAGKEGECDLLSIRFNSIHMKFKNPFQCTLTQSMVVIRALNMCRRRDCFIFIKVKGMLFEMSRKRQLPKKAGDEVTPSRHAKSARRGGLSGSRPNGSSQGIGKPLCRTAAFDCYLPATSAALARPSVRASVGGNLLNLKGVRS